MEVIPSLLFAALAAIAYYFVLVLQERCSEKQTRIGVHIERQKIAERIILGHYNRIYNTDSNYMDKKDCLIVLLEVLDVYGIGSQADACRNRTVKPPDDSATVCNLPSAVSATPGG